MTVRELIDELEALLLGVSDVTEETEVVFESENGDEEYYESIDVVSIAHPTGPSGKEKYVLMKSE